MDFIEAVDDELVVDDDNDNSESKTEEEPPTKRLRSAEVSKPDDEDKDVHPKAKASCSLDGLSKF